MATPNVKIVVVGSGASGKTAMIQRFVSHYFPEDYIPTVFDNSISVVGVNGREVSVGIWDTSGLDDYDRLRPLAYPDSNVAFLTFSVSNEESFEAIRTKWNPEIRGACSSAARVLVGTQTDTRHKSASRVITFEEGKALAAQIGAARYLETSALEDTGVTELFHEAVTLSLQPLNGGGISSLEGGASSVQLPLWEALLAALLPSSAELDQSRDQQHKEGSLKVRIRAGPSEAPANPPCSFVLKYFNEKQGGADELLRIKTMAGIPSVCEDGGGEGPMVPKAAVRISFAVRPEADPFELGELNGLVHSVNSQAFGESQSLPLLSTQIDSDSDGSRLFHIACHMHTATTTDGDIVHRIGDALNLHRVIRLAARIDLSQSSGTEHTDEALRIQIALDAIADHSLTQAIEKLLKKYEQDTKFTCSENRQASLDVDITDSADLLASSAWQAARALVGKWVTQAGGSIYRTAYEKFSSLMSTIKSAHIVAGNHLLAIETAGWDLSALLPTQEEL